MRSTRLTILSNRELMVPISDLRERLTEAMQALIERGDPFFTELSPTGVPVLHWEPGRATMEGLTATRKGNVYTLVNLRQ
jgi:hypothetical protein